MPTLKQNQIFKDVVLQYPEYTANILLENTAITNSIHYVPVIYVTRSGWYSKN